MNAHSRAATCVGYCNRELRDIACFNHIFIYRFGQGQFGWDNRYNNGFWDCLDIHVGTCHNAATWLERGSYRTIYDFFAGFNWYNQR